MSKGELIKKEIIANPENYLGAQGKFLNERLENVKSIE